MAGGAVVSVVIGLVRPGPWLLALLLVVVLALVRAVAIRGLLLAGAWAMEQTQPRGQDRFDGPSSRRRFEV